MNGLIIVCLLEAAVILALAGALVRFPIKSREGRTASAFKRGAAVTGRILWCTRVIRGNLEIGCTGAHRPLLGYPLYIL